MKAEEEAKELVEKFGGYKTKTGFIIVNIERAKQCALICVDEMIKESDKYENCEFCSEINWQEVKQEIEKL